MFRDIFETLWPTLRMGTFAMTCNPSHVASCSVAFSERERNRTQLISLLERLGCDGPLESSDPTKADAALATALMDAFVAAVTNGGDAPIDEAELITRASRWHEEHIGR